MIEKIIQFSLRHKFLVVLGFVGICIAGFISLTRLPIDAFPDVSPNLVQVFAEVEGTAPEEIEALVTRPIEVAMLGLPGVQRLRSLSSFGLSTVKVYFEDDVDIYFARQLVSERLKVAEEAIPDGLKIHHGLEMGPIASGMGKILSYYVEGDEYSNVDLRTFQDWIIKPDIQTVPGVAEVITQGGNVRQYQIKIYPAQLLKYDLTMEDIIEAVQQNNLNVGAGIMKKGSEEWIIRSLGLIETVSDIENIVIGIEDGVPVYVRDVARVEFGAAFRRGIASMDGQKEIVTGSVYKLHGANSFEVIGRLKERIKEINEILPPGVRIITFYDQSSLVKSSINTVREALTLGFILVSLVVFIFLGKFRNALIVVFSLPFSMLLAFIFMHRYGIPGDLISFGGVAIALGMIVDATIIMVEKIQSSIQENSDGSCSTTEIILSAGKEVGPSLLFSIFVIIAVFIPIFTLGGVEGKMFRPLAFAVTMTMLGSLLYSLIVAPAFCSLLHKRKGEEKKKRTVFSIALKFYRAVLMFFLPRRLLVVSTMVILLVLGGLVFTRLGKEFIPTLQEGTIQVLVYMDPNISLKEISSIATKLEKEILTIPEVKRVVSDIGYGEVGPHIHHTNFACITVGLYPRKEWKTVKTQEELVSKIDRRIADFPGASISFSQPIQHEIDDLIAGAGTQVVVKLFGLDFDILRQKAAEIEGVLSTIKGVADLRTEQVVGQTQVQIDINRDEVARHGLNIYEIQHAIHDAIGGEEVGKVFEEEKIFGITVRFAEPYRKDIKSIRNLLVRTPAGYNVPLEQLADIGTVTGIRQVTREDARRFISIQCNVRGRDAGGFVEEAQKRIAEAVSIPSGYRISWGGQFELHQAANQRLLVVVPITLFLILVLLYILFNSFKNVLLIILNIPLALVGGIFALAMFGENLSIPSSIGFIALFGITMTNGLVLITSFEYLKKEGLVLKEVIIEGSLSRLRAVLMATITTVLGLLPLIITTGVGSEIQRPLAIVVVGGLVSSTLLTLIVLPVIYSWMSSRKKIVNGAY